MASLAPSPAAPAEVVQVQDVPAVEQEQPANTNEAKESASPEDSAIQTPLDGEKPLAEGQEVVMQESKLHRLCAEGDVMGVRGILSLSLELLESIDPNTGLTPMLQAIYASQVPVVRELMAAGAYPPPPTVTQNPEILALLYPAHAHAYPMAGFQPNGIPHQLQQPMSPIQYQFQPSQGQHPHQIPLHQLQMQQQPQLQQGQAEFFQGYYPAGMVAGPEAYMGPQGKQREDGRPSGFSNENGNGHRQGTADQKAILCRNLPNCRFGAACHFFHPPQFQQPPFFAPHAQQGQEFHPQSTIPHARAPTFVPVNAPQAPSPDATFFPANNSTSEQTPSSNVNGHVSHVNGPPHVNAQVPSASTPAFVPTFIPSHGPPFPGSPAASSIAQPQQLPQQQASLVPPPSHESQSAPPADVPVVPNPAAIYGSPPLPPINVQPMLNGNGLATHARPAQAFVPPFAHQPQAFLANGHQQMQNGLNGLPQVAPFDRKIPSGHHAKKLSMGGGGRFVGPRGQSTMGPWPPACVFFLANKCRNGDMCKFPHLLADGTDCRNPDVIAGILPAAPVSAVSSAFPRGPKPRPGMMNGGMQNGFHPINGQQQYQFLAIQRMHAAQLANRGPLVNGQAAQAEAPVNGQEEQPEEAPKTDATEVVTPAPRAVSQSRSVPNTRAHSPTHSTASVNGPRGVRPTGRAAQAPGAASARSASIPAAPKQPQVKQRVPSADDFPVLGEPGQAKVVTPPAVNGKTAAQVLASPAPEKPVQEVSSSDSSNHEVTTESDDDSVLVSNKTHPKASAASSVPTSTPSSPPSRPDVPRAGMSFASIASSAAAAIESSSMVSLQA